MEVYLSGAQRQGTGHIGTGSGASALHNIALSGAFAAGRPGVGHQFKEAKLGLLGGVGGDKSAFSLSAVQQVFSRQFVDRLSNGALADAKTGGQVFFAGDGFPRFPLPQPQTVEDEPFDLLIKRTEGGRKLFAGCRAGIVGVGREGGVSCLEHKRLNPKEDRERTESYLFYKT